MLDTKPFRKPAIVVHMTHLLFLFLSPQETKPFKKPVGGVSIFGGGAGPLAELRKRTASQTQSDEVSPTSETASESCVMGKQRMYLSLFLFVSVSVSVSVCLSLSVSVCLSVSLSLSLSLSLSRFVWKFLCITFHSLIHAYMYINNACNLISTHQEHSMD